MSLSIALLRKRRVPKKRLEGFACTISRKSLVPSPPARCTLVVSAHNQDLLKARPNSTALVVSTENITQNIYHGNERAMLVQVKPKKETVSR